MAGPPDRQALGVFTLLLLVALIVTVAGVHEDLFTPASALLFIWLPLFSGTAVLLQIVAARCVDRWASHS